jgi:predicted lipoprotein
MRVVRWLIAVVIFACICWRFPLFHAVPLKTAAAEKTAAVFDPKSFTDNFWTNQLVPSLDKATKAEILFPAIASNPATAKKKFSRSIGVSENYFYFLAGSGKILSVSDDEVLLNVTGGTNTEVSLQTGMIFGNALRDGTGLLDASRYPNSQDFNAISEALNHLVEANVLPKLRESAKVGAKISFAGCAEVDDESTDLKPLKVIPIQTKAE